MELIWFRKDLRINDNPALYQACLNGPTQAVFFITPAQWQQHDNAPIQLHLMQRALNHLSAQLGELGIPLHLIEVDHFADIPARLGAFCDTHNVNSVYANGEVEINEQQRDNAVQHTLSEQSIALNLYQADCLLTPGEVVNQQGEMYKVFTPFKNSCLRILRAQTNLQPYPAPAALGAVIENPQAAFASQDKDSSDWPASEAQAFQALQDFIDDAVQHYHEQRDFPAIDATSKLGPCLALGIISAKQCVFYLMQAFPTLLDSSNNGATIWLSEILWREFYRHIMVLNPEIGKGANYNPRARNIIWNNNLDDFEAWCAGKTGYPMVDAAMQQLNQTGWMHNRLRMVCASFLTKHLLIDWRWGEKYFKQQLIDGDFASNNGGWQWAASTGCDAQPYFRIFNPTLQSKKFDPQGKFIRNYLPQRRKVLEKQLHEPIKPIVEHGFARQRALASFSVLKATGHHDG